MAADRRLVKRRQRWERSVASSGPTTPLVNPSYDDLREVQRTVRDRIPAAGQDPRSAAAEAAKAGVDINSIPSAKATNRMNTVQEIYRTGMSPGQVYAVKGWNRTISNHPGMGERPLPGMEHPDAVDTPPRWEDLSPADQKKKKESHLREVTGADRQSMARTFGAQLDQAHVRGELHGTSVPYAKTFYGTGEPKQVIQESAGRMNVSLGTMAAMNAFTSPNTKFSLGGHYPNNEAAMAAIAEARSGTDPDSIRKTPINPRTGKQHQGYATNFRKAVRHMQDVDSGVPLRDLRSEHGRSPFGPKTGPYHNAWLDSVPDFTVSDIHTGGGGMVPWFHTQKPQRHDPETGEPLVDKAGRPKREKSEREKAIEKANFHTIADEGTRMAMRARGVQSVREAQAAQWGEEKIQRGITPEDVAYPEQTPAQEIPGQQSLLPDVVPHTPTANTRTQRRG